MRLDIRSETWPFTTPFRITDYVFSGADVLVVTLEDGRARGHGEAAGVYYRGETPASLIQQIEAVRGAVEAGVDREGLRRLLPAGGARNALDAALWELEARRRDVSVFELAGVGVPRPLVTTFTVGAGHPDEVAAAARGHAQARAIKLKLTPDDPGACVRAARAARPDVWLAVDANQAFDRPGLERLLPVLAEAGVALVEQPMPVGADAALEGLVSPIPLAADESAQSLADLPTLVGRYQMVNIKLDKCGGLTEGLAMAAEARRLGLKVMVGCMSGTSLAMAPAFVLGQVCDVVDLDAPIFLPADRPDAAVWRDGCIWCPATVWGGAEQTLLHPETSHP